MAKPQWGAKRICQSCGVRYYDLRRVPIVCPKCSAVYQADAEVKPKRSRTAAVTEKPKKKPVVAPVVKPLRADEEPAAAGEKEEEGEELIEDASELGEDEADLGEVAGEKPGVEER